MNDAIEEISTNRMKQKIRADSSKICCMVQSGGYLYSGWRDGTIRIIKVALEQNAEIGNVVKSAYVAAFSVKALIAMAVTNIEMVPVNAIQIVD
jgi:hypothetical protein